MEQHFDWLAIPHEDAQVNIVAELLTGDVKMWWRRKLDQMAQGEGFDITT